MREISCYMYHHVSVCLFLGIVQDMPTQDIVASRCFSFCLHPLVSWAGHVLGAHEAHTFPLLVSSHIKPSRMSTDVERTTAQKGLEQFRRPVPHVPVRIHGRRFQCSRFPFPVSLQFSTKYTLRVCFPPVRLVDPLFITGDPFRNASVQAIPICSDGHCQADADVEDRDFEGSSFGRIVTGDSRRVIIMGYHGISSLFFDGFRRSRWFWVGVRHELPVKVKRQDQLSGSKLVE